MSEQYKEKTFETVIENYLLDKAGFGTANKANFDRSRCLDTRILLQFIHETQPEKWRYLEKILKGRLEETMVEDLCRALDSDHEGCLHVLRHGFKCYGKLLHAAYFAPASGLNPETTKLYNANSLTITRQLMYAKEHTNSLDLVISLNGIPVATAELKNPLTGQTYRDAIDQYKNSRDNKDLMFQFKKRALVHFALDPDEVYMTTRLSGKNTVFLPFNKGRDGGAGNPENPAGYKTAYLWEEVWQRDSFLDILARFMHLQVVRKKTAGKWIRRETMIFPRCHQLGAVRNLTAAAREKGAGHNYLVQHSAGSGKSNSIAWLAHRLSSLYNERDEKVFSSVVVVTDRLVLDQQLQDTIYQFEHKDGVVKKIDKDSTQLANSLAAGAPIIITTLQKFPFVTEKIGELPARQYAVIIDEAHSSQGGESAADLKGVLAAAAIKEEIKTMAEEEGLVDHEENILRTMAKRGKQENISFFAFTATPKYKTLEVFGQPGPDGKPQPFHLYSMRQAIEEGFILDVLEHYTTYKAYFGLIKAIADDPEVEKKQAARSLARFMSLHPHNIAQKVEVIIEHFNRFTRHKIGGRAKAMVIASSRLHAVRCKQAVDAYIAAKGYHHIKALVAFSGEVTDPEVPDKKYSEVEMNGGIKEKELPGKFASDDYQILIVAEKYQTGFDQPLLHTMYVDKRLLGIHAVQSLSRLNRIHPGKEDTFILDFVNETGDIRTAFQPYYERTMTGERVEYGQLYELQARLDGFKVYYKSEVEEFARIFYKPRPRQSPADNQRMYAIIDPAVNRYVGLDKESKEQCRKTLVAFRNLYAFLAQIIPFHDADLEKLYSFIRFLLNKLPPGEKGPEYRFDEEVALKFYRLQKTQEDVAIELVKGESEGIDGPTEVGTGAIREKEKIKLSSLIEVLNERFGTNFKPADQLFFDAIREDAVADETLRQAASANTLENFAYIFRKELEGLLIDRMEQNEEIAARFMNNKDFKEVVTHDLLHQVYQRIRNPEAGA